MVKTIDELGKYSDSEIINILETAYKELGVNAEIEIFDKMFYKRGIRFAWRNLGLGENLELVETDENLRDKIKGKIEEVKRRYDEEKSRKE
jgi:hypothetical protein